MTFTLVTLFPELLESHFKTSILGRAVVAGVVDYRLVDIRDYAQDKHRTCDDAPYGGGAGMVLLPGPTARALDSVDAMAKHVLFPTPAGRPFTQARARDLAQMPELVILCGRYEGIDQRIVDHYVDEELSIGDYVLSSGELAALVLVDTVFRLVDGSITPESLEEESFSDGLLEYPHYTRPRDFRGSTVPDILLSGNHEGIRRWRRQEQLIRTRARRKDIKRKEDHGLNEGS
jgi:tRNA (guanine37-N1)-methyltransferase